MIADVLERAKSTDPDAIVEALRKSNWSGGLMQYAGPVVFNEIGDNPNAVTTMIQILGRQAGRGLAARRPRSAEVRVPAPRRPSGPWIRALVAQGLLSGLLFGGVYSLMAVGLTLIFGVMRVVNFAHGDMMVWGMYLGLDRSPPGPGIDPYLGFVVCAGALFADGLGHPAPARGPDRGRAPRDADPPDAGVALVLENAALVAFGPDPQRVRSPLAGGHLWLGPIFVDVARLVTFALAHGAHPGALPLPHPHRSRPHPCARRRQRLRRARDRHRRAARLRGRLRDRGRRAWGRRAALVSPILPFQPAGGLSLLGGLVQHRDHRRHGGACPARSWAGCWSRWPNRWARCS